MSGPEQQHIPTDRQAEQAQQIPVPPTPTSFDGSGGETDDLDAARQTGPEGRQDAQEEAAREGPPPQAARDIPDHVPEQFSDEQLFDIQREAVVIMMIPPPTQAYAAPSMSTPYPQGAGNRPMNGSPGTVGGTPFEPKLPNHLNFPAFDGRYEGWDN